MNIIFIIQTEVRLIERIQAHFAVNANAYKQMKQMQYSAVSKHFALTFTLFYF